MNEIQIEEVINLYGGDVIAMRAKGHHEPQAFLDALIATDLGFEDDVFKPEDVSHGWYRNLPPPEDADCDVMYVKADGPGRGAYPVTILYF